MLGPAEAVQDLELCRRQRQLAVLVLAVEGEQSAAERLQVRGRCRPALHEGPRPALDAHTAADHDFVLALGQALAELRELVAVEEARWEGKDALHLGLGRARPDDPRTGLPSQEQVQRVCEDGLSGPRLARDDVEAGLETQLRALDQKQVLDSQL